MSTAALQIAFLTGRSDFSCWRLSPAQLDFLRSLGSNGRRLVELNFPYEPCALDWSPTHLLAASLSNMRDYALSRRPAFRARHAPAVLNLIDAAAHTVFLAGSCGLELFNNLALPPAARERLSVFAYGPVARRLPEARHLTVQGHRDSISRLWFDQADLRVDANHMSYLHSGQVREACEAFIAARETGLSARVFAA